MYAATGHRPDKLGGYENQGKLNEFAYDWLRDQNVSDAMKVISGLALGWDTAIALAAIRLGVPLIGAVPFVGQDEKWPAHSRQIYRHLIRACAQVHIVSAGGYANHKFQKRNEWMVDRCDVLVALWDGSPGGTGNCMRYAERLKLNKIRIINVWNQWTEYQ